MNYKSVTVLFLTTLKELIVKLCYPA